LLSHTKILLKVGIYSFPADVQH